MTRNGIWVKSDKKSMFFKDFTASILSILKLNVLIRKLGKKTFRFKYF